MEITEGEATTTNATLSQRGVGECLIPTIVRSRRVSNTYNSTTIITDNILNKCRSTTI